LRKADRRRRAKEVQSAVMFDDMFGAGITMPQLLSPDTPQEPDTPAPAPTPIEEKIVRKMGEKPRERPGTAERRRARAERAQVIDDGTTTVVIRSPDTPLELQQQQGGGRSGRSGRSGKSGGKSGDKSGRSGKSPRSTKSGSRASKKQAKLQCVPPSSPPPSPP
jgi:hypothetical protein